MYRLSSRIETGALAELLRGERDGQPVVVKLFFEKTSDDAYARAIAAYVQQLRACSHRGVVAPLELGTVQRRLAIVRNDVGQFSLGDVLKRLHTREVFLPPALALWIVIDVLDALQVAHQAQVLHGALTPGNIVIASAGHTAITDFGALSALQASPALAKQFANQGRSSYRAPELKGSAAASVASDLYSMGAICYELLTLHEASTGGSSVSTRQEKLPPPSRLARRLNSRIDGAVMRALEATPSRRFKTCGEFAEALRDAAAANGGLASAEELKRFTGSMFPNEVVFAANTDVPISEPFELQGVDSIAHLNEPPDSTDQSTAPLRGSFSLGAVRDEDVLPPEPSTRPTEIEMPIAGVVNIGEPVPQKPEPQTSPEAVSVIEAVQQWHAPSGVKASGPVPINDTLLDLSRRVRAVEDFGVRDQPTPETTRSKARNAAKPVKIPRTLSAWTTPFQRTDVPMPPDWRGAEAVAMRRVKQAKQAGLAVLFATLLFIVFFWLFNTGDKKEALISYLPDPIERAVKAADKKPGVPVSAPEDTGLHAVGEPAVAPSFDLRPKPLVQKPKCFQEDGSVNHAVLSVDGSVPVAVEIDGQPVCGSTNAVAVKAGAHVIEFTDAKTKRKQRVKQLFAAGKTVRLLPTFKTP